MPRGFEELRWKAPPALVELTRKMVGEPERIWGVAFSIWQEGQLYRSRMTLPFYALGYTAQEATSPEHEGAGSGAPVRAALEYRGSSCLLSTRRP